MEHNPATNRLSPIVQAALALGLLAMFAGLLFVPVFYPDFKVESDIKQTLFTLVTAVVFFFIGKNTDSATHERTNANLTSQLVTTAATVAAMPPPVIAPIKVDDSTPIRVTEETK